MPYLNSVEGSIRREQKDDSQQLLSDLRHPAHSGQQPENGDENAVMDHSPEL
jgi:hypothetical protein